MKVNINKQNKQLRTFNSFFVINILIVFVHYLLIKSVSYKASIVADSYLEVLFFKELYLTVLPLILFYVPWYFGMKHKYNIDTQIYGGLCTLVVLFYFTCAIDKYYPGSITNFLKHDYYVTRRLSMQKEQQKRYSKEVKDYDLLESIDDITLFVDKDEENLIIQYKELYAKYENVSRDDYNEFFEVGSNYDSSLKETIYSNNTDEYSIISSSFFTYVALDSDNGFVVYTYKPFESNRTLEAVYDNFYLKDENEIRFGEELNFLLHNVSVVEPFTKNEIKEEGNKVTVKGETKDYIWDIVKDENFEFTLKDKELDLTSAIFSESGEYVIKLKKKHGNSYITCSNTIIVKIN